MFQGIDLYSDTMTRPTPAMRQAMADAVVGDEQIAEDPTTLAFEEKVANLLGFERAMFVPTATLANEIAIKLHCEPGSQLVAAHQCHLFFAETGGPAIHAGAMARPIDTPNGLFSAEDLDRYCHSIDGPHFSPIGMVSVENTTNIGGGFAWPLDTLSEVKAKIQSLNLRSHLDGARLFNAVTASGTSAKKLCEGFDTTTICLSKGLGCAAGAVLAMAESQFPMARRLKQLFGGALRQSGFLAAAGLYALENHVNRLSEDHENAKLLAELLQGESNFEVENASPSTNMVFLNWKGSFSSQQFEASLIENGVRLSVVGPNRFRAVTHLDVSRSDIEKAASTIKRISRGA